MPTPMVSYYNPYGQVAYRCYSLGNPPECLWVGLVYAVAISKLFSLLSRGMFDNDKT